MAHESRTKTLKSADGMEIWANAVGDPSKPAIVFINGFSLSSLAFENMWADKKWLEKIYLVRYDVRGHGRSGKPTDDESWHSKRHAEDFEAVVEGFKLSRPFVAGWSMGATHPTDILTFHPPSYISGLIYIGAVPLMSTLSVIPSILTQTLISQLCRTNDVDLYQSSVLGFIDNCTYNPDSVPPILHRALLGEHVAQPRAVTAALIARKQDEAGLVKAAEEGLPVLVIHGAEDKIILRSKVVEFVQGWKNVEITIFEEVGHMPFLEKPDEFRERVLAWTGKVVDGRDRFGVTAGIF